MNKGARHLLELIAATRFFVEFTAGARMTPHEVKDPHRRELASHFMIFFPPTIPGYLFQVSCSR
jgi:hypothetical protein